MKFTLMKLFIEIQIIDQQFGERIPMLPNPTIHWYSESQFPKYSSKLYLLGSEQCVGLTLIESHHSHNQTTTKIS